MSTTKTATTLTYEDVLTLRKVTAQEYERARGHELYAKHYDLGDTGHRRMLTARADELDRLHNTLLNAMQGMVDREREMGGELVLAVALKEDTVAPRHNHDALGLYPGCPACGTAIPKEDTAA